MVQMQIMVVVQRGPEGHGARLSSCEHNLQLEPFPIWSGHLLDNGGRLVSGGMKIAGPIAACSADPPLDRWNGWVNCPLSSGMMKLGFSLTIRLETPKRSLIDLWRHTNSTIERL
jgi:hypothetical protein